MAAVDPPRRRALWFFLGVIAFFVVLGKMVGPPPPSGAPTTASRPTEPPIPYTVVQTWDIPRRAADGRLVSIGHGRVIVIDSTYRNEADLRRLGQQLHDEPSMDQQTGVEVFDDSLSANRRQRGIVEKLPSAQQRRFNRHLVGTYNRNRYTGWDSWTFGLNGITNEPLVEVRYTP